MWGLVIGPLTILKRDDGEILHGNLKDDLKGAIQSATRDALKVLTHFVKVKALQSVY